MSHLHCSIHTVIFCKRLTHSSRIIVKNYCINSKMDHNLNFDPLSKNHPENFTWLAGVAPRFSLHGSQVSVIGRPSDFYDQVLKRCQASVHRITIASLYLGTGELEQNLVNAVSLKLEESPKNLKVRFLLDFTRSSRGETSSRSLLLPLLKKHQETCKVALYHTPSLRGLYKSLLPQRWNEVIGLQHMKIYLFDNSVIISGANLSNDYFTNRQDRYLLIEDCPDLADFLDGLVKKVSDFSLELTSENEVLVSKTWNGKEHPFLGNKDKFVNSAKSHVWSYYSNFIGKSSSTKQSDTWIYPLIEMGQLGIQHDSRVTTQLIEAAPKGASLGLSTGYFNLTKQYSQSIIQNSKATFNILMAHPLANGFLGASGPAGGIPAAYSLLAHRFLSLLRSENQNDRVSLWEYQRPGWTYHAKGMWYCLPEMDAPSLTLIGSPNFGYRSVHRDLELQLAVVTGNSSLQQQLKTELSELSTRTSPFPDDILSMTERKPPFWVKMVVAFFKHFF